jgi:hypothetical protein
MIARTATASVLGCRTVELGGAYIPGSTNSRPLRLLRLIAAPRPGRWCRSRCSAPTAVGVGDHVECPEIAARFTAPQHFPRRTDHSVQTLDGRCEASAGKAARLCHRPNAVHPGVYCAAVVLLREPHRSLPIGASVTAVQASYQFVASIVEELRLAVDLPSNPLTDGLSLASAVQRVDLYSTGCPPVHSPGRSAGSRTRLEAPPAIPGVPVRRN